MFLEVSEKVIDYDTIVPENRIQPLNRIPKSGESTRKSDEVFRYFGIILSFGPGPDGENGFLILSDPV